MASAISLASNLWSVLFHTVELMILLVKTISFEREGCVDCLAMSLGKIGWFVSEITF